MFKVDRFLQKRATPFVVCILFLMIALFTTAIWIFFSILGFPANDVESSYLADRIMFFDYVDSLPVLMKLSNQWGFGGYYSLARDIYILNFLLLCAALLYNTRQSIFWQIELVEEIDQCSIHMQYDRLDQIERMRKIVFFCAAVLGFYLLFDDIADDMRDYFGNRMMFDPWNAMRVPLMTSLLFSCITYLMMTSSIDLLFEDEEEEELEKPHYNYAKAGREDAVFKDV